MDALLLALQPLFAPAFTLWGAPVSNTEVLAFVLAVAMVVLNIRVNPWAWSLAIASSLLYFALFWDAKLYGESVLQLLFVAVAAWGWWQWLRGRQANGAALQVRALPQRSRWYMLGALAVLWPVTAGFLIRFTDSDVPWWDGFTTSASVLGQWLLGRKYLETWPVWVLVNTVSVGLFAYKGLWLTTLLYALFVGMSVLGWRAWRAKMTVAP